MRYNPDHDLPSDTGPYAGQHLIPVLVVVRGGVPQMGKYRIGSGVNEFLVYVDGCQGWRWEEVDWWMYLPNINVCPECETDWACNCKQKGQ
jgi:hypothetical protein